MGWIDQLQGQVSGLVTSPLIYFIEQNPAYLATVRPFFMAVANGEFSIVTSVVTLLEVLVHPLRQGNAELAQTYRDMLLNTAGFTTILLSQDIAEEAARLRAAHNLRTPDSIQLATAIHAGASAFLTNDMGMPSIPGITLLVLDNLIS